MLVDPRDPAAVAEALRAWVEEGFGGSVSVVGVPRAATEGLDSYIHFVGLTGPALPAAWRAPLVVRLLPSSDRAEQAHREAAVQGWVSAQGFAAPEVLAVLDPDDLVGLPGQVMARAPGVTMADAMRSRPWRASALVAQLADLQLALHSLPLDGWPTSTDPRDLVEKRLSLPRRAVADLSDPELAQAVEQVQDVVDVATSGPRLVCHGDFHPLNVVVDGGSASVIDWTDAGIGPRAADLSRTVLLFHVAAIAATGSLERRVLRRAGPWLARRYRRAYEARSELDPGRMNAWEALHALHGWAQVELLHAGGFAGESSAAGMTVPPEVPAFLRSRFTAALAAVRG